ncbi:hypothetical protein [Roseateles toxinivorans]|uniref:Uncharacterized protein n=1 Tax=Roseateles toxinivorans TaxID=270368 RepID=A0A4R6QL16_9BURK|nr:hypothetical protein [Roseateles toxinivorans]TDP64093.1 hypothetical protein DES47_104381 [Roseateles toxinivorans]
MFTDSTQIAARHKQLREELKQRLADTGKWTGLPHLLDELHALKHQHAAALARASTAQA